MRIGRDISRPAGSGHSSGSRAAGCSRCQCCSSPSPSGWSAAAPPEYPVTAAQPAGSRSPDDRGSQPRHADETHKPLVYIDLSGWSPKYFPPLLIKYANTLLQDKVPFGSDYPLITPDRWLADFEALPIKPEVRPKILKGNAARLLGLAGG